MHSLGLQFTTREILPKHSKLPKVRIRPRR
jgi:hypothetical protein